MKVFVRFEVFDTVIGEDAILRLRDGAAKQFQKVLASGKVEASGIFVDGRAGFFVLDVDSAEEIAELFNPFMVDNFHLETHPLISFEKLGELFKKWAAD